MEKTYEAMNTSQNKLKNTNFLVINLSIIREKLHTIPIQISTDLVQKYHWSKET